MASECGLLRTSICQALEGLMKTTNHLIFGDNQEISETGIEQGRLKFVTLTYPFLQLVVRHSSRSKKNNALQDHVRVTVIPY
jgi:hypothetical protein